MSEQSSIIRNCDNIIDLLPEIILILDDDLAICEANALAVMVFHPLLDPPHGANIFSLLAQEQKDIFRNILPLVDQASGEIRMQCPDGRCIDASWNVRAFRNANTRYWFMTVRDISEEKKKNLDLLRFSNVIHNTINPIQITDANGKMVYVNPAFEKISGYSSEELIGKNPRILNSGKHDKDFWLGVWNHITGGKVWVGRIENRRKDGSPIFMELVISPIVDSKEVVVGYLGAHRDITEQKVLEQQLVRSQKMESIGTLAAGIAHEVGNPLTAISSLVQVIQRTTADGFAKEKLELINSQVSRITRIIRELVDFSRPSTYIVKPTDVNKVIHEALNIVHYGKKVKNISFALNLSADTIEIIAVQDQIVQVFINILMNAVDALEDRGGEIAVITKRNAGTIEIMVRDSGKGIEPSELEKIFEPFYTTKETGQGTGLGLWVSYGIVKSFNGDIFVESIPNQGSTFTITFPVKGE